MTYTFFKQGFDLDISLEVTDGTTPVVLSGASSIIVGIFVKESLQISFATGITCGTYENINSISGSTINIFLTRSITKDFCLGDVIAKVLVKDNNIVKEYSVAIGTCEKGYLKDLII